MAGVALIVLAVGGALALLVRASRSLLRVVLRAAEEAAASGVAEIGERRGDLTAMREGREARHRARAARRRDAAWTLLWLLWFALPLFTPWAREAYALAAPLWVLPSTRRPPRRGAPG